MTVKIYRAPVIRVPLPPEWLFSAQTFAKEYSEGGRNQNNKDEELKNRIRRWSETWYLCTCAFVWYFGGDVKAVIEQTLRTGWTPSIVLETENNKFYCTTASVHEEWCFGSKTTGTMSQKQFARSKAGIFVMTALVVPDVDIIGWLPNKEFENHLEGKRQVIRETTCRPMMECPDIGERDTRRWYV